MLRQTLVLLGAVAALSFAGPLTKLSRMDPMATLAWRCGAGYIVLVLLGRRSSQQQAPGLEARELPALFVASLGFVGFVGLWRGSFQYMAIGPSTVIVSMAAVFTFLADWALTRSGFEWRKAAGVAAAMVAIAPCLWSSTPAAGHDNARGVLLSLAGAVCGSIFVLAVARGASERKALSTWTVVSAITAVVAAILAGSRGVLVDGIHPAVLLVLLALAVVPHCLGQGLVVLLSKEGAPLFGVVAVVGETVGASVLALFWFQEPLSLTLLVSIACFGLGLMLITNEPKVAGVDVGTG